MDSLDGIHAFFDKLRRGFCLFFFIKKIEKEEKVW